MKHPEKWYIPVTEENRDELQPWWRKQALKSGWTSNPNAYLGNDRLLLSQHPNDDSYYYTGTESGLKARNPSYEKITLEQFRQITNSQPMKHPEKWYIPVTEVNREELDRWRQSVATSHRSHQLRPELDVLLSKHRTDGSYYYASNVDDFRCCSDYKDYQEINLEQFREITNQKLMKHPEKWYIPVTEENHAELNQWRLSKRTQEASRYDYKFVPGATLLSAHPYDDDSYFYAKGHSITERDNGYQEITLEQFRQITNPNQTQTTMTKQIRISRELLNEYYEAATTPQRAYLSEHFKLDGITTDEAIRGLHDMACSTWKPRIKKYHPDCFPEESKHFDFSKHADKSRQEKRVVSEDVCESLGLTKGSCGFIQVRNNSCNPETHHQSFYLSSYYNWELVQDGTEEGRPVMVLIPTKKSC